MTNYINTYYWTFFYSGDSFPFIKGDSIGVYGIIYSDDTLYSYDNLGRVTNTFQALKIQVLDYCPGMVENYQLTDFEKTQYLNQTYTSEDGKTITFTLDNINDRPITILGIRKYGDWHLQITFRFDDVDNGGITGLFVPTLFIHPSGRATIDSGGSLSGDYYKPVG